MVALVDRGSAWSLGWSGSGFLAWSYGSSATLLHRSVGDSEWHPRDTRTRGSALFGVADRGIRAGLRSVAACSRLPTAWHVRDAHAPASPMTPGGAWRAGA